METYSKLDAFTQWLYNELDHNPCLKHKVKNAPPLDNPVILIREGKNAKHSRGKATRFKEI